MKTESRIVARIREALQAEARVRKQSIKIEKRHGSEFSIAGEPDLFGCVDGRHFEIEVKVLGKSPEPIQHLRLKEWSHVGALTGWATNAEEAIGIVWPTTASP